MTRPLLMDVAAGFSWQSQFLLHGRYCPTRQFKQLTIPMPSTMNEPVAPTNLARKHKTPTGDKCQFLLAKEQYKLKTVFSNYLSLGQFELARGIFQHLKRYNGSENLLDTLVILGPPKEWLYSISVPSSAHLAWLCCSLREELYGSERNVRAVHSNEGAAPNIAGPIPRWIIKQHELDILLTTALLDGAALQWQSLSPNTVNLNVKTNNYCLELEINVWFMKDSYVFVRQLTKHSRTYMNSENIYGHTHVWYKFHEMCCADASIWNILVSGSLQRGHWLML